MFRSSDGLLPLVESKTTTPVTVHLKYRYTVEYVIGLMRAGFLGLVRVSGDGGGRSREAGRRLSLLGGRLRLGAYD